MHTPSHKPTAAEMQAMQEAKDAAVNKQIDSAPTTRTGMGASVLPTTEGIKEGIKKFGGKVKDKAAEYGAAAIDKMFPSLGESSNMDREIRELERKKEQDRAQEALDNKAEQVRRNKGRKPEGKKAGGAVKMAKGGLVKSSASRRADGAAQRGKTKGRTL
jgi:hypothetical protein